MLSVTAPSAMRRGQPHLADRSWLWRRTSWPRWMRRWAAAFDIRFVFNQWTLGEEFCQNVLGIPAKS